mmetsp:Transcript_12372/g.28152  ORF Transcript_12372/g.28152 Transcript_12372/m.28152 type:complete len:96 (+) Transcript_12372:1015-1302(+)
MLRSAKPRLAQGPNQCQDEQIRIPNNYPIPTQEEGASQEVFCVLKQQIIFCFSHSLSNTSFAFLPCSFSPQSPFSGDISARSFRTSTRNFSIVPL